MMHDDWFETHRFPNGITRIREPNLGPLHAANLWLVEGRERALLIDAGVGVRRLRPVIEAVTPLPVTCLLTHAHYDHMGGAYEFPNRLAHRLEAAALSDPTPENTLWRGWLTDRSFLRRPTPDFRMAAYRVRPAPPTGHVDDGSIIDLGSRRLEILHVPGHAPGLLAVYDRSSRTLFTSDALYAGRMFFDLPGSDRKAAARSVQRLSTLGAQLFHPGHMESFDSLALPKVVRPALLLLDAPE